VKRMLGRDGDAAAGDDDVKKKGLGARR